MMMKRRTRKNYRTIISDQSPRQSAHTSNQLDTEISETQHQHQHQHQHHDSSNVNQLGVPDASAMTKPRTVSGNSNLSAETSEQINMGNEYQQPGYYNPTPAEMFNGKSSVIEEKQEEQYYHIPAVSSKRPKTPLYSTNQGQQEYGYGYNQYGDNYMHRDYENSENAPYTINNYQNDYYRENKLKKPYAYFTSSPTTTPFYDHKNNNYTYSSHQEANLFDSKDASRNYLNIFKSKNRVGNVDLNPQNTEMYPMPSAAILDRNGSRWTELHQQHQQQQVPCSGYDDLQQRSNSNPKSLKSTYPSHQIPNSHSGDYYHQNHARQTEAYPRANDRNIHNAYNNIKPRPLQPSTQLKPKQETYQEEDKRSIIRTPIIENDKPEGERINKLQNDINREYKLMNIQDKLNDVNYSIGRLRNHRYDYSPLKFEHMLQSLESEKSSLEKEIEVVSMGISEPVYSTRAPSLFSTDTCTTDETLSDKSQTTNVSKNKLMSLWRNKVLPTFNLKDNNNEQMMDRQLVSVPITEEETNNNDKANEIADIYNGMFKSGDFKENGGLKKYERHTEKRITKGDVVEETKTREIFLHDSRDLNQDSGKFKKLINNKRLSEFNKTQSKTMTGSGELIDTNAIADNITNKIAKNLGDYQRYITGIKQKKPFSKLKNKFRQGEKIIELDASSDEEELDNSEDENNSSVDRDLQVVVNNSKINKKIEASPTANDGITQLLRVFTSSFQPFFNMFPFFAPVVAFFNLLYSLVPQVFHPVVVALELGSFLLLIVLIHKLYKTIRLIAAPFLAALSIIQRIMNLDFCF